MKVYYAKGRHVIIHFSGNELQQALKVLKALAKAFKAAFLCEVAEELEFDLNPRPLLTYDARYHLCEACKMEIDTHKDSHLHQNGRYTHYTCPVLKERQK